MIEALTDNRNRAAAEIRGAFTKYGGALGETNSVAFMFNRVGVILFSLPASITMRCSKRRSRPAPDDVATTEEGQEVLTTLESFIGVRDALEKFGEPLEAELVWRPNVTADPKRRPGGVADETDRRPGG